MPWCNSLQPQGGKYKEALQGKSQPESGGGKSYLCVLEKALPVPVLYAELCKVEKEKKCTLEDHRLAVSFEHVGIFC